MKNQNDLIISIVAIVLALIIAGVCFGTKREPTKPADPEKVNLAPPTLPQGDVVMANSLSGGGSGGSGGFGGPGGAGPGGPSATGFKGGAGKPKFGGL
jgi:hypothetical protein